jgi:hypothetical protein
MLGRKPMGITAKQFIIDSPLVAKLDSGLAFDAQEFARQANKTVVKLAGATAIWVA